MPETWTQHTGAEWATSPEDPWDPHTGAVWPFGSTPEPELDADAEAFLTAAAISDETITTAIDELVIDLKAASLWSKLFALWPFVGATAAKHKWNLKDPRDVDAAYRLTFSGSYTHDANGITPDGSTAYADTHLVDNSVLTATSASFGVYSRTSGAHSLAYDMGAGDGADAKASICIPRYGGDRFFPTLGTSAYASTPSTDGRGFFAANRNSATNTEGYKNGTRELNVTDTVTLAGVSFYLTAHHRGTGPMYFGQKNLALVFVAQGLSQAEHADFYDAVQAFQTALGREV